eukprot:6806327-Ditylum_brightwellii.AAC.1
MNNNNVPSFSCPFAMTKPKTKAMSKKSSRQKVDGKKKKETQGAQGENDQKETKKKRNDGHGPGDAAAVMGSTAKTDGAESPGQCK